MNKDCVNRDEIATSPGSHCTLRFAREAAVQVLYSADLQEDWSITEATFDSFWRQAQEWKPAAWNQRELQKARRFAHLLIDGVKDKRTNIDDILGKHLQHWSLSRVSTVDRSILRLAVYELVFGGRVPPKAVMNEAIEIAKNFGDKDSGRFVNGVLDSVMRHEKLDKS